MVSEPHEPGVAKPTSDDLVGWLKLRTPVEATLQAQLDEAFDAALDEIESRITNVFVCADGYDLCDSANWPPRVRSAVLLRAARLFKRALSPEGVAAMAELGMIHIAGTDTDVEKNVRRYLKMSGFS